MTTVSATGTMGGDPARPWLPSPTAALSSASTQEVDAAEIQVQVCLYAFDLIYLNGEVSSSFTSRAAEAWQVVHELGRPRSEFHF